MDKHFHLDRVKIYLDSVLAEEEHLKTYKDVVSDVYRVNSHKPKICVRDVEQYLRGLPIGVDYNLESTEVLAKDFAKDIQSLTAKDRSRDDVYWWALATAIFIFGGVRGINPSYRGEK